MKVVLSPVGKFHTFDLVRELHARGTLSDYGQKAMAIYDDMLKP
jgi:hypothetical protein